LGDFEDPNLYPLKANKEVNLWSGGRRDPKPYQLLLPQ